MAQKILQKRLSKQSLRNLFYDLYALDFIWDYLVNAFNNNSEQFEGNSFVKNLRTVVQTYRLIQIQNINPRLSHLLSTRPKIANLDYTNFQPLIISAQNGSNQHVEEIEYSYIFYGCVISSILFLAALGLTGKDMRTAFELVGDLGIENPQFNTLEQTITSFSHIVAYKLTNGEKKGFIVKGKNKKLASLW